MFFQYYQFCIVVKHKRHPESSGDEGCLDEDDKITIDYRPGMRMHDKAPRQLLKGLLFYTVVQYNNSRLVFGDNFVIIFHKYPYNCIFISHLHHLSVAVLL